MWKSMNNCAWKWCRKLCAFLFAATWAFGKMWVPLVIEHDSNSNIWQHRQTAWPPLLGSVEGLIDSNISVYIRPHIRQTHCRRLSWFEWINIPLPALLLYLCLVVWYGLFQTCHMGKSFDWSQGGMINCWVPFSARKNSSSLSWLIDSDNVSIDEN